MGWCRVAFAYLALALNCDAAQVTIQGREIFVDGCSFHMKGINWNPIGKGGVHPGGLDWQGYMVSDIPLMKEMGINTIRTYEALTDTVVLDELYANGIYLINTIYSWGGSTVDSVDAHVAATKDHPALLMWAVGNEWNYNGLYTGLTGAQGFDRIHAVSQRIKTLDQAHPVSTVYGEVPSQALVDALTAVDVWGINAYRGIVFGDLFDKYKGVSTKPMYMGEYGADAWNALINQEDQQSQADATAALTTIITQNAARTGGVCWGGLIFEFADEWWKDDAGSANTHETGGTAPGGGPHPDATFNEEWWGIVTVDRVKRLAFDAYKNEALPPDTCQRDPTKGPTKSPTASPAAWRPPTVGPLRAPKAGPTQVSIQGREIMVDGC
eukprot:Hpha_TRINITY_DN15790_c3_g3::TRINITY_DN15790_c3_g3_i3::g.38492::m.38492